jgi:hypothetical protein
VTPATIEALRAAFKDGDIVAVEWYDPRTLLRAPWDIWCDEKNMQPAPGESIGFIYDLPDEKAVLLQPHVAEVPFGDERDEEHGEIMIPYSSIRSVRRPSFVDADWSLSEQSATGAIEVGTRDRTL